MEGLEQTLEGFTSNLTPITIDSLKFLQGKTIWRVYDGDEFTILTTTDGTIIKIECGEMWKSISDADGLN